MDLQQGPFGISAASLARELNRRTREHRRRIAPRHAHLLRLQAANADLAEYATLLAAEVEALQAHQQALLRELAAPPPDPAQTLETLRSTLQAYQQAHHDLVTGVLALLEPFLTVTDSPLHPMRADWREKAAWLSERHTGSEGR
jgi:hypothetical protein